ncbi:MAG TPA: cytochrome c biogenesis protein CcdA [Actinophytocola sp.]|uniref:cytochrome c biogenesis CcdA family protein n=1 Tax=Actinophytocola sp. TaxID=1872138 RepID=UPI002DDCE4E8|nr:cytochrome c biogenesis protein CcdA [Actinophytocola sp.]HEV2782230.1 cytochrome c biogenesis protein CcdA [Actinophytocola sp.]
MTGELTVALVAGMLATVNPCGFAMLPGYLALVVSGGEDGSRATRVGRALAASALMTAGFVAVFGVFGLLSLPIAGVAQRYLPIVTIVVGLAMVIVGILLLAGREPLVFLPKLKRGAPTTRVTSMLGYGVAFAVASLSCTIAPFLAVAGVALRGGDLRSGLSAFVAYALGMGLVVGVLAVAAALASTAVAAGIRRLFPYLGRIGGALLVVTGAYVGYYGSYELRLYHAQGSAEDPVIDGAARIQAALSDRLDAIGPVPLVIALAALVGGAVLVRRRVRA